MNFFSFGGKTPLRFFSRAIFLSAVVFGFSAVKSQSKDIRITVHTSATKFMHYIDCTGAPYSDFNRPIYLGQSEAFINDLKLQAVSFAEGLAQEDCRKLNGTMSYSFVQNFTTQKNADCNALAGTEATPSGGHTCNAKVSVVCTVDESAREPLPRTAQGLEAHLPPESMCGYQMDGASAI